MKRDINIIRDILPRLSQYEDRHIENEAVEYHLNLLMQARLITGQTMKADGTTFYSNLDLTNDGYELLATITNEGVWEEVKRKLEVIELDVNSVPLSVVKELAVTIITDRVKGL